MDVGDGAALVQAALDGQADRPVGGAPADHREGPARGALIDRLLGDVVRDAGDLLVPRVGHALMVLGIVGDVARIVVLLEPADAVFEAGGARPDPGPGQRLRVPPIGLETLGLGVERHREGLERVEIGQAPRLGRVGDEGVAEDHDGRHVAGGETHRLDRDIEGLGGRAGGEHHQRRIRIAPVDGEIEVGLLGLGRHAGRRAGALGVEEDQRQLGGDGEAERLGLERDAGARARGDAEGAGVRGADRGPRRGDLVLGLEGHHIVGLETGQLMQHRGGRRDRVGAEHQLQPGKLRPRDEAPGQRLGPGDGPVEPRPERCGLDLEGGGAVRRLRRLAEGMARLEAGDVGGGDGGHRLELGAEPVDGLPQVAVVNPVEEAQSPQVLGAQPLLLGDPALLDRLEGQLRDVDRHDAVAVEAPVVEGIGRVARLLQVLVGEGAGIDDDQAPLPEVGEIDHQGRGVHADQDVRQIARGHHGARAEIDLEGGDAVGGAHRRPDFRREVGEGGQVVAGKRGGLGEAPAGQLHAVAGIPGEADHGRLQLLARHLVKRQCSFCHGRVILREGPDEVG